MSTHSSLRVGVGGPVRVRQDRPLAPTLPGRLRGVYDMAVVTNDIYTREDAEFLLRHAALEPDRIMGVETGGCPHTAIREDASLNLAAIEDRVPEEATSSQGFLLETGCALCSVFRNRTPFWPGVYWWKCRHLP